MAESERAGSGFIVPKAGWSRAGGGYREVMPRSFNVITERDSEGYYIASVPDLPGCHTQARSLDELMLRIREAIELCLEVEAGTI